MDLGGGIVAARMGVGTKTIVIYRCNWCKIVEDMPNYDAKMVTYHSHRNTGAAP